MEVMGRWRPLGGGVVWGGEQAGGGGRSSKCEETEWKVGMGGVRGMEVRREKVEAPGWAVAGGNSEEISI